MKPLVVKVDTKLSKALGNKPQPLRVTVYSYLKKHGGKTHKQLETELDVVHASMVSAVNSLLVTKKIKRYTCECCSTTKLFKVTNI